MSATALVTCRDSKVSFKFNVKRARGMRKLPVNSQTDRCLKTACLHQRPEPE